MTCDSQLYFKKFNNYLKNHLVLANFFNKPSNF